MFGAGKAAGQAEKSMVDGCQLGTRLVNPLAGFDMMRNENG